MYTPNQIKERLRQQPFVPLRFVASSGDKYEVRHPDMVWVGVNEIHVGNPSSKDPTLYSGVSRLALMHITGMEDLPVPVSSSGNGQTTT